MKDGGRGRIVNFSSGSVFQGAAGQSHYAAAKAGALGLTRSLACTGWRSALTASCSASRVLAPPPAPWPWDVTAGPAGCGSARRDVAARSIRTLSPRHTE